MKNSTLMGNAVDPGLTAIVASVRGDGQDHDVLATAMDLGRRFGAEVRAVHGRGNPNEVLSIVGPGVSAAAAQSLYNAAEQQIAARRQHGWEAFEAAAGAAPRTPEAGFWVNWTEEDGRQGTVAAGHCLTADLVVAGRPGDDAETEYAVEALLFNAGVPVLLMPPGFDTLEGRHIGVAWDGGVAASRALRGARALLRRADKVSVITVQERRKTPTAEAARHAIERLGKAVETLAVEAGDGPVGEVLGETATKAGCDLLVMGAYGHSRLREFMLGGATRSVLRASPLPALLCH